MDAKKKSAATVKSERDKLIKDKQLLRPKTNTSKKRPPINGKAKEANAKLAKDKERAKVPGLKLWTFVVNTKLSNNSQKHTLPRLHKLEREPPASEEKALSISVKSSNHASTTCLPLLAKWKIEWPRMSLPVVRLHCLLKRNQVNKQVHTITTFAVGIE